MQTPDLQAFASDIGLANEEAAFVKELNALRSIFPPQSLRNKQFKKGLYNLYQLQIADMNPFMLALNNQNWLKTYFNQFLDQGFSLPKLGQAKLVFLQLAARPLSNEYLERVLDLQLLDDLSVDRLQVFAKAHPMNQERVIDYAWVAATKTSDQLWKLGVDLLLHLPPGEARPGVGDNMLYFVNTILPFFTGRFAYRMTADRLYEEKTRIKDWFLSWEFHEFKSIEDLPEDDPYYEVPYEQIVKYVPEYILWNNGMKYGNQTRVYTFNSPGFRHLALGGSIRKGPDQRFYTRRMARTLVSLPYNFPYPDFDLYLYAFCESLGVKGLLHEWLQDYVSYPNDLAAAKTTLDRWNPIIQKLAQLQLQNEPTQVAQHILGYVYHCLRDQEGFSLQGRSLAWLQGISTEYYENIQERALERERIARERRELWSVHRRKQWSWKPHSKVKPYHVKPNEEGKSTFRIVELCTKKALDREGAIMNHCVGSYVNSCKNSATSIWSLQEFKNEKWYSMITIELVGETIRQARGRFNSAPTPKEKEMLDRWVKKEGLEWALWA